MLVPCGTCGTHLRESDACPHCGESARRGPSGVALLLGLALVSCAQPQPLYGASPTDLTEGDTDTDTDADTDATGDTGAR